MPAIERQPEVDEAAVLATRETAEGAANASSARSGWTQFGNSRTGEQNSGPAFVVKALAGAGAVVLAMALVVFGCSSPASQFNAVMAGIQERAKQTREYVKVSKGVYKGGPQNGQRYEFYEKTKWTWEILGRDIQKTDSVTSPYIATVQYRRREHQSAGNPTDSQKRWRSLEEAKGAQYERIVVDDKEARFLYKDRVWQCLADDADFPVVDKPTYEDGEPAQYLRLQ
jgi:hypothetical protein